MELNKDRNKIEIPHNKIKYTNGTKIGVRIRIKVKYK